MTPNTATPTTATPTPVSHTESSPAPAIAPNSALAAVRALSTTSRLLFGGAAVAAIGSLMPWEQDTTPFGTHVTAGPASVPGGVAMLFGLLAAVVWIGWPTRTGTASKARRIGLTVVAAALTFLMMAKFSALGNAAHSASVDQGAGSDLFGDVQGPAMHMTYSAGSGLYIYGAGVIAICVGAVRTWLARSARSGQLD